MIKMRMNKTAFTLTEMIVAIILTGIIAFAVSYIFMEGFRSYVMNRNLIDLRAEARAALKRIVFEIRQSETIPAGIANGIKIRADIDEDGIAEEICYQLVGQEIRRTVGSSPDPNAPIILGNVSSMPPISGLGTDTITIDLTVSKMDDVVRLRTKVRARCS